MRKLLIGLLMTGAVIAPSMARAQDGREGRNRHEQREDRDSGVRQDGQRQQARSEQRAARMEARSEQRGARVEARSEQRAARIEARQQRIESAPAQAQVEVAQREGRRGGRGGWRGNDNNVGGQTGQSSGGYQRSWQRPAGSENSDGARRYDRRDRDNAARYGTGDQRREAIQDRRGDRRDWRQDRREDRRDLRQDRREDRRDWRQDRRGDRRDWNRNWRSDRRYAWQDWRSRNRSLFRLSPYYSPYRNFGYRRFSIGLYLDQLFFDQRYWIGDPFYYRLPPAEPGTQWVRYYNDVLLVDIYTGEVIDAIYDFFW